MIDDEIGPDAGVAEAAKEMNAGAGGILQTASGPVLRNRVRLLGN